MQKRMIETARKGPAREVAFGAPWSQRPGRGQGRGYVTVWARGDSYSIECEEHRRVLPCTSHAQARSLLTHGSVSFCLECQESYVD